MLKVEKILTRKRVENLGLDNVSVITANMLKGYTSIGDRAFYGCIGLTSIKIPNSVTSIGSSAFSNCGGLTSVTIPNSVTNIGDNAFYGCNSLPVVDNLRYADTYLVEAVDKTLSSYTIKNGTKWIGYWAFSNCRSLTSVTIPNSVTSIETGAFYYCSSLASVTIPNSVTSIETGAFADCGRLTSVTIPNSVTSIGGFAFYGCTHLASVTIPNSVTSIKKGAFYNCNFKQEKKTDKQGRIIAYKGFNADMTCRGFQYKEGETYKIDDEPILCVRGFHACLNPLDCFTYYSGEIGEDVVFHEVYLDGVSDENHGDGKVVAKKITIGREISPSEMADIASGRK